MSQLSVVINTRNAAATLESTLASVKFADEIIVVDMASEDETEHIARRYTTHFFTHPAVGYVEPARNFALSKATNDWILIVDADETVPPQLAKLVTEIVNDSAPKELVADCCFVPRLNFIFGQPLHHTGWWPDYQLRLFKKQNVKWSDVIHAVPETTGKTLQLPARHELALRHQNYQTVEQFIERMNRYTSIQAKSHNQKESITSAALLRAFRQEFLTRFFALQGYQDHTRGMGLSLLQALSEVTMTLKQWQEQGFKAEGSLEKTEAGNYELLREIGQLQQDLKYWVADWQVARTTGVTKLWWRVRRKWKI